MPASFCTWVMAPEDRKGAAIGAIRCHCIEAVETARNPCPDRYLFALQPVRIPASIPGFMMRSHDGHDRIGKRYPFENLRAHHRMDLHLFEFVVGELAGLVDDVFRYGELADVVQRAAASGLL